MSRGLASEPNRPRSLVLPGDRPVLQFSNVHVNGGHASSDTNTNNIGTTVRSRLNSLFHHNDDNMLPPDSPEIDMDLELASPNVEPEPFKDRTALKVLVVTWNMCDALPKGDLSVLLGHVPKYEAKPCGGTIPDLPVENIHPYHVVVFAAQECPTPSGVPRGLGGGFRKGVGIKHDAHKKDDKDKPNGTDKTAKSEAAKAKEAKEREVIERIRRDMGERVSQRADIMKDVKDVIKEGVVIPITSAVSSRVQSPATDAAEESPVIPSFDDPRSNTASPVLSQSTLGGAQQQPQHRGAAPKGWSSMLEEWLCDGPAPDSDRSDKPPLLSPDLAAGTGEANAATLPRPPPVPSTSSVAPTTSADLPDVLTPPSIAEIRASGTPPPPAVSSTHASPSSADTHCSTASRPPPITGLPKDTAASPSQIPARPTPTIITSSTRPMAIPRSNSQRSLHAPTPIAGAKSPLAHNSESFDVKSSLLAPPYDGGRSLSRSPAIARSASSERSNDPGDWIPPKSSRIPGEGPYLNVAKERLLGLYLSVFVFKGCEHLVKGVDKDFVTAGLAGGRFGNKGGIGISLNLAGHRLLFVNAHLAAHAERNDARLANIKKIKSELKLDCFLKEDDPRAGYDDITDRFDTTFWMGDLNFRVDISQLHAKWLLDQKKYQDALMFDQLKKAMEDPETNPLPGFKEAEITFMPTFKYDVWKSVRATNRELRRSIRRRKTLDRHAERPSMDNSGVLEFVPELDSGDSDGDGPAHVASPEAITPSTEFPPPDILPAISSDAQPVAIVTGDQKLIVDTNLPPVHPSAVGIPPAGLTGSPSQHTPATPASVGHLASAFVEGPPAPSRNIKAQPTSVPRPIPRRSPSGLPAHYIPDLHSDGRSIGSTTSRGSFYADGNRSGMDTDDGMSEKLSRSDASNLSKSRKSMTGKRPPAPPAAIPASLKEKSKKLINILKLGHGRTPSRSSTPRERGDSEEPSSRRMSLTSYRSFALSDDGTVISTEDGDGGDREGSPTAITRQLSTTSSGGHRIVSPPRRQRLLRTVSGRSISLKGPPAQVGSQNVGLGLSAPGDECFELPDGDDFDENVDYRVGVYDTSKKQRVPSWCDRVLWKSHIIPDDDDFSPLSPTDTREGPFYRLSHAISNHFRRRSVVFHDNPMTTLTEKNEDPRRFSAGVVGPGSWARQPSLIDPKARIHDSPERDMNEGGDAPSTPPSTLRPTNSLRNRSVTFHGPRPERNDSGSNVDEMGSVGNGSANAPTSSALPRFSPRRGGSVDTGRRMSLSRRASVSSRKSSQSSLRRRSTTDKTNDPSSLTVALPPLHPARTTGGIDYRRKSFAGDAIPKENKNMIAKFLRDLPGRFHSRVSLFHGSDASEADLPAGEMEPVKRRHLAGEVEVLHYGTIDDAGMRQLEGRSDHRPAIFSAAVYV